MTIRKSNARIASLGCLAVFLLGAPSANSEPVNQHPGWGLGLMLGYPLGLNAKYWVGGAVAFASGFCGYYGGRFCQDRFFAGVRVPFGVDARLRKAPVDFGLELAPGIWVGNYVEALFDGFLFVRYVF